MSGGRVEDGFGVGIGVHGEDNQNIGRTQRLSSEPLILSIISAAATTVYSFLSQQSEEDPAAGALGRRRGTDPRNRRRDFVVRRGFESTLYESRRVNCEVGMS